VSYCYRHGHDRRPVAKVAGIAPAHRSLGWNGHLRQIYGLDIERTIGLDKEHLEGGVLVLQRPV